MSSTGYVTDYEGKRDRGDSKMLKILIFSMVWGFLISCSAPAPAPAESAVLEQIEEPPSAVSAEVVATTPETEPNQEWPALEALLQKHGYEGVGLQYESTPVLKFLQKVFSDPRAAKRKIKSVYTGAALAYDAEHESLTIGGTQDVEQVFKFIAKNTSQKPESKTTKRTVSPSNQKKKSVR
jgi:hypothetical protein